MIPSATEFDWHSHITQMAHNEKAKVLGVQYIHKWRISLFSLLIHKTIPFTKHVFTSTQQQKMYTSTHSVLAALFLPAILAWAPAMHPDPTKLPKALEFAKKAWHFPNVETLQYPISPQQSGDQNRRRPWSLQEKPEVKESEDFYFDGLTPVSLRWPTRQAFLVSLPKSNAHIAPQGEANVSTDNESDCNDFYYDDSGDVLCWATSMASTRATGDEKTNLQVEETEECAYGYFDRIGGEELCWLSFLDNGQTVANHKTMTQHPGLPRTVEDEDCDHMYYDDTGNAMCWAFWISYLSGLQQDAGKQCFRGHRVTYL